MNTKTKEINVSIVGKKVYYSTAIKKDDGGYERKIEEYDGISILSIETIYGDNHEKSISAMEVLVSDIVTGLSKLIVDTPLAFFFDKIPEEAKPYEGKTSTTYTTKKRGRKKKEANCSDYNTWKPSYYNPAGQSYPYYNPGYPNQYPIGYTASKEIKTDDEITIECYDNIGGDEIEDTFSTLKVFNVTLSHRKELFAIANYASENRLMDDDLDMIIGYYCIVNKEGVQRYIAATKLFCLGYDNNWFM